MAKQINGVGPAQADIVIVGEAAGEEEEKAGIPFVGKSGKLLDSLLADAGIDRAKCYVTNLVKEHPPYNDIGRWYHAKGGLTELGLETAKELVLEVEGRHPRIVVALGNVAKQAITGDSRGITTLRGAPIAILGGSGTWVCIPSIHPAAILRGAWMDKYLLAADLAKAGRFARGEATIPRRNLRINQTFTDTLQYILDAQQLGEVGFDIENSAETVTCFSLAHSPLDAMSIALSQFTNGEQQSIWDALKELLESREGSRIITQNGNYDTYFLREFYATRTVLERVEDTMCAHHVMLADLGGDEKEKADGQVAVKRSSKSLALLASLYTNEPYYKDEGKKGRQTGDFDQYLRYNAKDAAVTLECWQALKRDLASRPGMQHTYRELTMKRLPAIQGMQSGMLVDRKMYARLKVEAEERVKRLNIELQEEVWPFLSSRRSTPALLWSRAVDGLEQAEKWYKAIPKMEEYKEARDWMKAAMKAEQKQVTHFRKLLRDALKEFNPDSSDQCCAYFYDFLHLPIRRNRETGQPTVDDDTLAEFARPTSTRPAIRAAQLIQDIRGELQQIETFLSWELDGDRFRASFNLRGTKFGRLSSSKLFFRYGGNMQNVPPKIRQAMLADLPFERAA